jgi:hypothetical protein
MYLKALIGLTTLMSVTFGLDRRPTISFITQPEIVTDIGGRVEMLCSVQYAQDYPVIWMKLDPVDRNNDLVNYNHISMTYSEKSLAFLMV